MKTIKAVLFGLFIAVIFSGCSRIEQGHVGIRVNWDKTIDHSELNPGTHSSVTSEIIEAAANEISLNVDNIHPLTKDKTRINDMDFTVLYSVDPKDIADLYMSYKNRHDYDKNGTVYVMYKYLDTIASSAAFSAVAGYNALEANDNRKNIEDSIRTIMESKLKEEGLNTKIKVGQVNIRSLDIDPQLTASNLSVIRAQNDLRAKDFEVQTARKEAERMQIIASQSGTQYIDYMKAQANLVQAQAIGKAIESGHVPNWVIMPAEFHGNVNLK